MLKVESIVNSIFSSMTWILSETEDNGVWLVDCGDVAPIMNQLGKKIISGVLLTHAHFDHIYGLPELIKRFPSCKIFTNESGRDALADARQNMSLYHEFPLTINEKYICLCGEGDEIKLFRDMSAKVYATSGHHPSCLTFMASDYLFTGDAYIPSVKVVTKLPRGNRIQAKKSTEKILQLAQGKVICPGHGEMVKMSELRESSFLNIHHSKAKSV